MRRDQHTHTHHSHTHQPVNFSHKRNVDLGSLATNSRPSKNESPDKISSKVSHLGESASLLGFIKVQNGCKEIRTIAGEFSAGKLSRSEALDKLRPKIDKLKTDYEEIKDIMIQFYGGLGE